MESQSPNTPDLSPGSPEERDPQVVGQQGWPALKNRIKSQVLPIIAILVAWFPPRVVGLILGSRFIALWTAFLAFQIRDGGLATDPEVWERAWFSWDGQHYLNIAENGYSLDPNFVFLIAFFPLYPKLVSTFAALGWSPHVVAVAIANLASFLGMILLYHLTKKEVDEPSAFRAVAIACVFPTAYFWGLPYTEGLFLLLTVGSLLSARYRQWWLACLLGGLASFSRITGILLLPVLLLEWWQDPERRVRDLRWFILIPSGLVGYMAINYTLYGDWVYFLTIQREKFNRTLNNPFRSIADVWRFHYPRLAQGTPNNHSTVVFLYDAISASAGYLTLAVAIWYQKRWSYILFAALSMYIFTSSGGGALMLSMGRYILGVFPFFIWWGTWLRDPGLQWLLMFFSVGAMVYFTGLFVLGSWAH